VKFRIGIGAGVKPPRLADFALDHGPASRGRHILTMAHFVFRYPAAGFNVQQQLDDDEGTSENEYEAVTCQACTRLHLLNRKTASCWGKLTSKGGSELETFLKFRTAELGIMSTSQT